MKDGLKILALDGHVVDDFQKPVKKCRNRVILSYIELVRARYEAHGRNQVYAFTIREKKGRKQRAIFVERHLKIAVDGV